MEFNKKQLNELIDYLNESDAKSVHDYIRFILRDTVSGLKLEISELLDKANEQQIKEIYNQLVLDGKI